MPSLSNLIRRGARPVTRSALRSLGTQRWVVLILGAVTLGAVTLVGLAGVGLAKNPATDQNPGPPAGLAPDLRAMVKNGGVAVGLDGQTEWSYHDGTYIPASILKLATAQTALTRLGDDFRFSTRFYLDADRNLYIKGFGDPVLISEEWALIAEELKSRGMFDQPLKEVRVDDSAFERDILVDGASESLNPYDARLGALVSNFNSIMVELDRKGNVRSLEPQTPLTPTAQRLAHRMKPGRDRISLSAEYNDGLFYSGELAQAIFARYGAKFTGGVALAKVPPNLKEFLHHRSSHTLADAVRIMLRYSNNYVANQIVLVMALEAKGEPAHLEDGVALIREHLKTRLNLGPDQVRLVEGSGLSRKNQVTLGAMLTIADGFYPWEHLMTPRGQGDLMAPAKTGTLTGVYTLAGFLPAPQGRRRPFVILLNQNQNTRDKLFLKMLQYYQQHSQAMN
ncbi:MAG: D-alanyl-D-alanine carboxypeptidase [Deltaproteobacteria bacterium]|nr:D-alanyl-D-alanine carboxypeptidase [Deltaproteobacteria bacterium]